MCEEIFGGESMDTDLTNPNLKSITTPLTEAFDSQKVEEYEQEEEDDEDGERSSLLSPRKGGMSKKRSKSKKSRRKVQWNDRNGNKLAEVREFQPSDVSDTDDEDLDSCICSVM